MAIVDPDYKFICIESVMGKQLEDRVLNATEATEPLPG